MVMETETQTIQDWVVRQRIPAGPGPHSLILMLHGWTGDEASMWVFADRLPENALLVAPRGQYRAKGSGYGWHRHEAGSLPWMDDFQPAVDALLELLQQKNFPQADISRFGVMGFSQGAALGYALAMQTPARVSAIAGLSGFMPQGADALARNRPLEGKQAFVAHGSRDDLVPVARARLAVETLEEAGAAVTYCEDDVGHKLSASCFQGLQKFFADRSRST